MTICLLLSSIQKLRLDYGHKQKPFKGPVTADFGHWLANKTDEFDKPCPPYVVHGPCALLLIF